MAIRRDSPRVGEGGFMTVGSDLWAFTVRHVTDDEKIVVIQKDDARLVEGSWQDEHQVYEFYHNPDASMEILKMYKDEWGEYYRLYGSAKNTSIRVRFGERREYRDPSI